MSNIIRNTKIFTLGGDNDNTYIPETNEQIIEDILKVPAVTMRNHRDELIEFDTDSEEPTLKWKKEILDTFDNFSLVVLRIFAQKRRDYLSK